MPSPPEGTDPDPRFSFANERTFLAWIRTALGLIVAGLAVVHLLPELVIPGGRRVLGIPLIALGLWVALTSYGRWRRSEQALRMGLPLPRSAIAPVVAYGVAAMALIAVALSVLAR